jgi:HK97 family phage major capsid protein
MATRTTINPEELRNRFRAARRTPQLLEIADQVRIALRQVSDEMDTDTGGNGSGGDDAELAALFAALKGLLDEISTRITRQATIDHLERRASGQPVDGAGRDWQRRCCEFSLFRAAAHAIGLSGVDASREIEVQQELIRRSGGRAFTGNVVMPLEALSVQFRHVPAQQRARLETRDVVGTTTPAAGPGGALIGTYTDPEQYIDILRPAMAVRQAGARVLTGLTSNLRLPRMTRGGQPGWFAENTPIPVTDEAFDDVDMTPHHDGAIVEVTRNALQQANPEIEALVRNDLGLKLANDVDITALAGTGVAPQPLGIVTDPLVPTVPAGALAYDNIVDLIGTVATNNALNGSLAFVGDSGVMVAGMKLIDLYGRPLGDELLYHGYPTFWTNLAKMPAAPTDPLVFGNWADLVIGFWSELDVLVNPYESTAYSKGNVQIRAAMTLDIAKRHPESFAWLSCTIPPPAGSVVGAQGEPRRRAA